MSSCAEGTEPFRDGLCDSGGALVGWGCAAGAEGGGVEVRPAPFDGVGGAVCALCACCTEGVGGAAGVRGAAGVTARAARRWWSAAFSSCSARRLAWSWCSATACASTCHA
eukprot:1971821-Pleurochrysis_carterae.AAC.1